MKQGRSWLLLCGHVFLCLSAISALATPDVPAGQRPGCPANCGDVDIPFPFGIGERCALHSGFKLNCTIINGTTKALNGNIEVTKISVPKSKIWMKTTMSRQCYYPATRSMNYSDAWVNFTNTPFSISEVDNKIVVIGCNALAYMTSASYVIGCYSTCKDATLENGKCSGAGCCQADVPKDIQYYKAYFNENYNTTKIWKNNPCNYMALMEKAAFSFNTSYVESTVFGETYNKGLVPLVANWKISLWSCEVARKNMSSYACVSSHSECVDSTTNVPGYHCKCSKGYKGNPYITAGCQDVDECLENANPCGHGICKNTPGNYSCSCHPGNHMTDGFCVPIQKSPHFPAAPVVGASVGLVVFVIAVAGACLMQERRKLHKIKQNYFRQHGGLILFEEMKSKQGGAFKIFSEEELQQATNSFSDQQVVGHGGHGTVYKGLLKGGVEVAVKRCTAITEQHKKEFGKEMLILSQINHRNVVKLLGCCLEVEVPMLVYEFVPNGTLFHLIHGGNRHGRRRISLATRLGIAYDSADALAYLHSSTSTPILHGDVKSSNILLDGDYRAKVSDFGASILAPNDESQFVTVVQGTCGYLDPEYMQTCQLTEKSDVYSFGVVLLELLTGKKPLNLNAPDDEKSLLMVFMSAVMENKLEEILDDQIKGENNVEFLEGVVELAKHCLEMCGQNRPTMKEVADKLDRLRKVAQHPWEQQNSGEDQSLLGVPSSLASSTIVSDEYFSIKKNAIKNLQSGR